ncbi:class I SAM-dependent methyltransferase [Pseudobacter ginsenosidimutans]|jgi:ubiquinone/menaquinone biosynthesis C-methylase UbiE|uniref:Methyltransferase family protein n=1 Tax=Pseudobacter ginsenosidimutans TaxID=661488 RepID=A0A4Q7MH64_9BACT|nr:class I SAM-dependent methyltransferase [Pseudobacter ginsenosidimutans]QEC45475.1 class I SAM-dependent methyltransferase [Pseudobacter ginsenosidimutans]RZS67007.1 methyltransferase family protein [Pseudobacter ginsenosidimutans]
MDNREAGRYWNDVAEAWTALTRAGFDVFRDGLNTPAFFSTIPDLRGLKGADIGCGEGHNTRLLAEKGAQLQAIDISEIFISHAKATEMASPLGIQYQVASATALPFGEEQFDFATSFMCLMDMPDPELALLEAFRVLKPGGFLQFSITHPCFDNIARKSLRDEHGMIHAIQLGPYFQTVNGELFEWTFNDLTEEWKHRYQKFKVPYFNKTLTEWVNAIMAAGFAIEMINEPKATDEAVKKYPLLRDAQSFAYFMHFRCRK